MLEIAARAAGLAMACLLLAAVAHKAGVLGRRTSSSEPLIALGPWTRRHADTVLVSAVLLELGVAVLLVGLPAVGYLAFAGLLTVYTWRLRLLDAAEDCDCFGELLAVKGRTGAIKRNVVLGAAAAILGGLALADMLEPAALSAAVVAAAAVPIAMAAAVHLLNHQLQPTSDASRHLIGGRNAG